jgi:chromosomal replication initiation ATPase DnaA
MFQGIRRHFLKLFREFLVYHHSSLEYRAKLLTLMVSANGEICACEKQKLKEIAHKIYKTDYDRAMLLVDTVHEYHVKIVTNNGLDFEHLIAQVQKETKSVKRFVTKIDITLLSEFSQCTEDEDEKLFQTRILEFMENLKSEYSIKYPTAKV